MRVRTLYPVAMFIAASLGAPASASDGSELYVEEANHLRLDLAFPADFKADPSGHAAILGLGARLRLAEYRERDSLGLALQVPLAARFEFNRFDVGNVLVSLEHRPESWVDDAFDTKRTGLRYGVFLPTLATAAASDLRAQRKNLALAMGGLSMLDAGHFLPGIVGPTFDYYYNNLETSSYSGTTLIEFRAGAALLFPMEDAASFALPVHMTFRVGFGAPVFLFCVGSTMSAMVGGDIDELGAVITGSMGVLMQLGASRLELMFDLGGAFGSEFIPTLVTTGRLGWTSAL